MAKPDTKQRSIGVGVVGLGFMGATHIGAYTRAAAAGHACRLAAVCDASEDRLTGLPSGSGNLETGSEDRLFEPGEGPGQVRTHRTLESILEDDSVDLISVCTPTASHVEVALAALAAGKHVLVEKPVAVRASEVERLAEAADRAFSEHGLVCMPAMCMRFWPAWAWIRERIASGEHGRVTSASFQRLGSAPTWSGFYADLEKSGGALVDLHVHDADFVHHCFGAPDRVEATGSLMHVVALYGFSTGPGAGASVMAEGGWDHDPAFGFRMRCVVSFERATVDFDIGRDPPLVLHARGASRTIDVGNLTGYDGEVRALVDAIAEGGAPPVTVGEAASVMRTIERERRALDARSEESRSE